MTTQGSKGPVRSRQVRTSNALFPPLTRQDAPIGENITAGRYLTGPGAFRRPQDVQMFQFQGESSSMSNESLTFEEFLRRHDSTENFRLVVSNAGIGEPNRIYIHPQRDNRFSCFFHVKGDFVSMTDGWPVASPKYIQSAEDNPDGLHGRYIVLNAQTGERDRDAVYFVLRLDNKGNDKYHVAACRVAARAYAETLLRSMSTASTRHLHKVAKELLELLDRFRTEECANYEGLYQAHWYDPNDKSRPTIFIGQIRTTDQHELLEWSEDLKKRHAVSCPPGWAFAVVTPDHESFLWAVEA